jgi:hypothetical protein
MYIAVRLLVPVVSAIWPVPFTYSERNTTVVLTKGFTIEFNGPNGTVPVKTSKVSTISTGDLAVIIASCTETWDSIRI